MKYCPKCNNEYEDHVEYCADCSGPVALTTPVDHVFLGTQPRVHLDENKDSNGSEMADPGIGFSVIGFIFFAPFGIIALFNSAFCEFSNIMGQSDLAETYSQKARSTALGAIICGLIIFVLLVQFSLY